MRRLPVGLLCGVLIIALSACSPVSKSDIAYIEKTISSAVDYTIDRLMITEYKKEASISVGSTVVAPEEFGLYVEQVLPATLAAVADKNIPVYKIDICIQDPSGDLVMMWSSSDGKETGMLKDYRSAKAEMISDVKVAEIQAIIDAIGGQAQAIAQVKKHVLDNTFYKIDTFAMSRSPSDHEKLTALVITQVMSKDSLIVERFEDHARIVGDLVTEALADVDLKLDQVIVYLKDKDGEIIKTKFIGL